LLSRADGLGTGIVPSRCIIAPVERVNERRGNRVPPRWVASCKGSRGNTADIILLNCVINLAPREAQVFSEAFRVPNAI
jgi:hypothetical protein